MKKLTIPSIENLISLGYWLDTNSVHRRYIERHNCLKCRQKLAYEGYANLNNYLAFGICQKCGYGQLFEHLSDMQEPVKFEEKRKSIKIA